jgi:16S rRNA (uracil1498-N3)-methyltransferase
MGRHDCLVPMTRRRFYAPSNSFNESRTEVTLSAEETRHLRDVLRLTAGDSCNVFDGEGREYECRVRDSRRDSTILEIVSGVSPARSESELQITLALALLKGEKFDLAVQKTTELGVHAIVPVVTKLADIKLKDAADAQRRVERWKRIALEAAKQSGRARVPDIFPPTTLSDLLQARSETGLMFSERLGQSLEGVLANAISPITILVGSEGGWTDSEINEAREAGWQVVTLGGRTMRAETAAIAVTALIQHRLGDLK